MLYLSVLRRNAMIDKEAIKSKKKHSDSLWRSNEKIIESIESSLYKTKTPTRTSLEPPASLSSNNSSGQSKNNRSLRKKITGSNNNNNGAAILGRSKQKRKQSFQNVHDSDSNISYSLADFPASKIVSNYDANPETRKKQKRNKSFENGHDSDSDVSYSTADFPTSTIVSDYDADPGTRKKPKRKQSFENLHDSDSDSDISYCTPDFPVGKIVSDYDADTETTQHSRKIEISPDIPLVNRIFRVSPSGKSSQRSENSSSPSKIISGNNNVRYSSRKRKQNYKKLYDSYFDSNYSSSVDETRNCTELSDFEDNHVDDDDYRPRYSQRRGKRKEKVEETKQSGRKTDTENDTKPSKIIFDDANRYRELRDRNNEASRRSRLNRKLFEIEIQQQAIYLESENIRLISEVNKIESAIKKIGLILMKLSKKENKPLDHSNDKNNLLSHYSSLIRSVGQINKSETSYQNTSFSTKNSMNLFKKSYLRNTTPPGKLTHVLKLISVEDIRSRLETVPAIKPECVEESLNVNSEKVCNSKSQEIQIARNSIFIKTELVDDDACYSESEETDQVRYEVCNSTSHENQIASDTVFVKTELVDDNDRCIKSGEEADQVGDENIERDDEIDEGSTRDNDSKSCDINDVSSSKNSDDDESGVIKFRGIINGKKTKKANSKFFAKENNCSDFIDCDDISRGNSVEICDKINKVEGDSCNVKHFEVINQAGNSSNTYEEFSRHINTNSSSLKQSDLGSDDSVGTKNNGLLESKVNVNKKVENIFSENNYSSHMFSISETLENNSTEGIVIASDDESSTLMIVTDEECEEFHEASDEEFSEANDEKFNEESDEESRDTNNDSDNSLDSNLNLSLEELDVKQELIRLEKENIILKAKAGHIERTIKEFSQTLIQSDRSDSDIRQAGRFKENIKHLSEKLDNIRKRNTIASRKFRLKRKLINLNDQQKVFGFEKKNKLLKHKVSELEMYISKLNKFLITAVKSKK